MSRSDSEESWETSSNQSNSSEYSSPSSELPDSDDATTPLKLGSEWIPAQRRVVQTAHRPDSPSHALSSSAECFHPAAHFHPQAPFNPPLSNQQVDPASRTNAAISRPICGPVSTTSPEQIFKSSDQCVQLSWSAQYSMPSLISKISTNVDNNNVDNQENCTEVNLEMKEMMKEHTVQSHDYADIQLEVPCDYVLPTMTPNTFMSSEALVFAA